MDQLTAAFFGALVLISGGLVIATALFFPTFIMSEPLFYLGACTSFGGFCLMGEGLREEFLWRIRG